MLSVEQEEQERLYHLKNAIYMRVMQKPPAQRNARALSTFMAYHNELQERVRSSQKLNDEDIAQLMSLSREV